MTTFVTVRHIESGEQYERNSLDAADLLATGEYEQTSGPTVRVALRAVPKPEPGPAYAKPPEMAQAVPPPALDRPYLKHRGFGKWDVFKADGAVANTSALDRAAAETLLATLH